MQQLKKIVILKPDIAKLKRLEKLGFIFSDNDYIEKPIKIYQQKFKQDEAFYCGRDFMREKVRIRDNHTCQKCGKGWEKSEGAKAELKYAKKIGLKIIYE